MSIAEKLSKWAFPCEHRLRDIIAAHEKVYVDLVKEIKADKNIKGIKRDTPAKSH